MILLSIVICMLSLPLVFGGCASAIAHDVAPADAKRTHSHLCLALWRFDAWTRPMFTESPLFAYYDDGTVIFDRGTEDYHPVYYSTSLSSTERLNLRSELSLLKSGAYSTSNATDQPRSYMWWRDSIGNPNHISVYGHFDENLPNESEKYGQLHAKGRDSQPVPETFIKIFNQYKVFDRPKAKRWLPKNIEVMISPGYSPDSHEWPKGWPDLHNTHTRKWPGSLYSYSIYLPARNFPRLLQMMKIAPYARINDDPYSLEYRFPFPEEDLAQSDPEK